MEQAKASGCFAVAMDVDAAGLPFLKNMTPPAGSKSVAELAEIVKLAERPFIVKGVMTVKGALKAKEAGAAAIVVSNHGGRQRDGVLSSARALPAIADAVKGDITILADSGIRNGLDVVRMIALGADSVLLGRAYLYALATHGQAGVANLLNLIEKEMKVAMTLTGAKSISEISHDSLVQELGKSLPAALAPLVQGSAA